MDEWCWCDWGDLVAQQEEEERQVEEQAQEVEE